MIYTWILISPEMSEEDQKEITVEIVPETSKEEPVKEECIPEMAADQES